MDVSKIVTEIDAQIAKLQQARALLSDSSSPVSATTATKAKRGRPKGSVNKSAAKVASPAVPATKRKLSPAGRKAIADAMKKRWAERKRAQG